MAGFPWTAALNWKADPELLREAEGRGFSIGGHSVTESNGLVLVKEKPQILHLERELNYFLEREKNNFFREKPPLGKSQK